MDRSPIGSKSHWIGFRSQEFRDISERIEVATRHSSKLSSYCWDEADLVREVLEELIGKPVGESSISSLRSSHDRRARE
jgi:hypothetical protein